tara:strand:- start:439 stop:684 length:246 start_codon:yes stop_codon:yes gene_type:complete
MKRAPLQKHMTNAVCVMAWVYPLTPVIVPGRPIIHSPDASVVTHQTIVVCVVDPGLMSTNVVTGKSTRDVDVLHQVKMRPH